MIRLCEQILKWRLLNLFVSKKTRIKKLEERLAKLEGAAKIVKRGVLVEDEVSRSRLYPDLKARLEKSASLKRALSDSLAKERVENRSAFDRVFDSIELLIQESHLSTAKRGVCLRIIEERQPGSLGSILKYLEFIDDSRS